MRAVWISVVLLLLMSLLIVASTVYGRHVCATLEDMIALMTDEPSEQNARMAERILVYWQAQAPRLRPLVNRTVVRTMSDLVGDLVISASPDADALCEYRAAKHKLLGAIDEMRRAERATFGLWS